MVRVFKKPTDRGYTSDVSVEIASREDIVSVVRGIGSSTAPAE